MALINQGTREIQLKIVYYGPAQGGKTTNLERVHADIDTGSSQARGALTSLATSSDRTLFFDFLPLEAVTIKGYRAKFQLFTVPGQVIYSTTRQLVLRGVDGIVFVADSRYEKMEENVESFADMEANLNTLNLRLNDVPLVIQFNKRDLPEVAPVEYMEYLLNNREIRVPSFESSALEGKGVFETLNALARLSIAKYVDAVSPGAPAEAAVPC